MLLSVRDDVMLGTCRIENLPETRGGSTVFAPGPKAPSMPWIDKVGKAPARHQRLLVRRVLEPRAGHVFAVVLFHIKIERRMLCSLLVRDRRHVVHEPGTRIRSWCMPPCAGGCRSVANKWIRSFSGSWTDPP